MTRLLTILVFVLGAILAVSARPQGTIALTGTDLKFGDVATFAVDVQDLGKDQRAIVALECEAQSFGGHQQTTIDLGERDLPGEGAHLVSFVLLNTDSAQLYLPATCEASLVIKRNNSKGNTIDVEVFGLAPIPYF